MREFVKNLQHEMEIDENICIIDVQPDNLRQIVGDLDNTNIITNTISEFENKDVTSIHIPDVFTDVEKRIKFAVAVLLDNDEIEYGDELFVIAKLPTLETEAITSVNIKEEFVQTEIIKFFLESNASTEAIYETLSLAVSLAQTGSKGSPIGALFVVGDENEVLDRSKPLNYNPYSGADVHVSDEVVEASISEFAKLDGAFVISNEGKVVSSNRYLEPKVQDADVPSGLGSRHMAGSGITESANAVSIVVSESDQKVRCFMHGELVIELDPSESDFI